MSTVGEKRGYNSILIHNIQEGMEVNILRDRLKEFGPVKGMQDFNRKYSSIKIEFEQAEDAARAKRELNYTDMKGHEINIQFFLDKEQKNKIKHNNLVIKGVPQNVTSAELHNAFSQFGEVFSLFLKKGDDKQNAGIGYVQFFEHEDKLKVLEMQNQQEGEFSLQLSPNLTILLRLEEFHTKNDDEIQQQQQQQQQQCQQQANQFTQGNALHQSQTINPKVYEENTKIFIKNFLDKQLNGSDQSEILNAQKAIESNMQKLIDQMSSKTMTNQITTTSPSRSLPPNNLPTNLPKLEFFVQYNPDKKNFWSHLFGTGTPEIFKQILEFASQQLKIIYPSCEASFKHKKKFQEPSSQHLICFGVYSSVTNDRIRQWLNESHFTSSITISAINFNLVKKKDTSLPPSSSIPSSHSSNSSSAKNTSSYEKDSQLLYINFLNEREGAIFRDACKKNPAITKDIFSKPRIDLFLTEKQRQELKQNPKNNHSYIPNQNSSQHSFPPNQSDNHHFNNNNNNITDNSYHERHHRNNQNIQSNNIPPNYHYRLKNRSKNPRNGHNNTQQGSSSHQFDHNRLPSSSHYSFENQPTDSYKGWQHTQGGGQGGNQYYGNSSQRQTHQSNHQKLSYSTNNSSNYGSGHSLSSNQSNQGASNPKFHLNENKNKGHHRQQNNSYQNTNQNSPLYSHPSQTNQLPGYPPLNNNYRRSNNSANYSQSRDQNLRNYNNHHIIDNHSFGNNNMYHTRDSHRQYNQNTRGIQDNYANSQMGGHNQRQNFQYMQQFDSHNQMEQNPNSQNGYGNDYYGNNEGFSDSHAHQRGEGSRGRFTYKNGSFNQKNYSNSYNKKTSGKIYNQQNGQNIPPTPTNDSQGISSLTLTLQNLMKNAIPSQNPSQQDSLENQKLVDQIRALILENKNEFILIQDNELKSKTMVLVFKQMMLNLNSAENQVGQVLQIQDPEQVKMRINNYMQFIDKLCSLFVDTTFFPIEDVLLVMDDSKKFILKCEHFTNLKTL